MPDLMAEVERKHMKKLVPQIEPGDTVRVRVQVTEGEGKEQATRTHTFQGTVIACRGGGLNRSITVRRVTYGIGVERTFPLHSPAVVDVEIMRRAEVRRAKLYYLRYRHERAARLKERRGSRVRRAETTPATKAGLDAEPEAPAGEADNSVAPATEQDTE